MCAAGLKGSLTFEGQQYLAFTGHDDDGITLFRVDFTSARVEWVDTLFDGDAVDGAGWLYNVGRDRHQDVSVLRA